MISFDQRATSRQFLGLALLAAMATPLLAQEQAEATKPLYPDVTVAPAQIKAALAQAEREHKRVILDFGGNWCGDCHALDKNFHRAENAALLKHYFVLVDVNIGRFDKNLDIAKKYGVPLTKGVPALAVLDSRGNSLYSQKNGEFEAMRTMDPSSVNEFLEHWKDAPAHPSRK